MDDGRERCYISVEVCKERKGRSAEVRRLPEIYTQPIFLVTIYQSTPIRQYAKDY
jgi:hypothetical protein